MKPLTVEGLEKPWTSNRAALRFTWAQFDQPVRRRLVLATAAASVLALLDFAALLMMSGLGALIALTLTAGEEQEPPLPDWVPLDGLSNQQLIVVLGGTAAVLLVAKSVLSWRMNRRIFLFMAKRTPELSLRVFFQYLRAPFPAAQSLTRTQVVSAVTSGPTSLVNGMSAAVAMITETVLVLTLVVLMIFASPLLFIAAVAYFALVGYTVSRLIARHSERYGRAAFEGGVAASETLNAAIGFAPEIRLYGMASGFAGRLAGDQNKAAVAAGLQQTLFQAPRYILESAVILGMTAVAGIAFAFQAPAEATFTLAVFTLTSARLVPSLLRFNGAWGALNVATAQSVALEPVVDLPQPAEVSAVDFAAPRTAAAAAGSQASAATAGHPATSGEIAVGLRGVGYQYPQAAAWALREVDLRVPRGAKVALVGETGSGKSTLALVIAGLIEPTEGSVERTTQAGSSEYIAIVPQDVYLAPDTVRANIVMPIAGGTADDARVWQALADAQVDAVVRALPQGLDTELGERGVRLSGGEIQRIGLARALYREPELLVLDEATSSLDAETERRVSDRISRAAKKCTVVTIAHRLATIREADIVVLMASGRVVGTGTFDELVAAHPEFAVAATLQGLLGNDAGLDGATAQAPGAAVDESLSR